MMTRSTQEGRKIMPVYRLLFIAASLIVTPAHGLELNPDLNLGENLNAMYRIGPPVGPSSNTVTLSTAPFLLGNDDQASCCVVTSSDVPAVQILTGDEVNGLSARAEVNLVANTPLCLDYVGPSNIALYCLFVGSGSAAGYRASAVVQSVSTGATAAIVPAQ